MYSSADFKGIGFMLVLISFGLIGVGIGIGFLIWH